MRELNLVMMPIPIVYSTLVPESLSYSTVVVMLLRSNEEVATKKLCRWVGETGFNLFTRREKHDHLHPRGEARPEETRSLDTSFYSYLLQLGYSCTTKLILNR